MRAISVCKRHITAALIMMVLAAGAVPFSETTDSIICSTSCAVCGETTWVRAGSAAGVNLPFASR